MTLAFWLAFTLIYIGGLTLFILWIRTLTDYRRILWEHYNHRPRWHWWQGEPPG